MGMLLADFNFASVTGLFAGANFGCGVNPAGAMATLGLNGNAFSRGRIGCHCVLSASVFIARVDSGGGKVFNEIVSRSLDPPGVDCSSRGAEASISSSCDPTCTVAISRASDCKSGDVGAAAESSAV